MALHPKKVVTRFAPSPTGFLHVGAYRTAIFAYLYARKNEGKFILRIEDTDKVRSAKIYEDNILESLAWLELKHDEFARQSENIDRHREVLEKLIADNHAYISKEEAKDGSGIIREIVRFRNPNSDISFHDEIKGEVIMNTADLGDFVIAKNIHEPLFHLAVVVDDADVGVTHVIRGEDHVSNTPRQILIQRAMGVSTPVYAHLPLVLGTDKQKLSKRRGALALTEYRERGYLPQALLNMVSLVGWNPGTEQEIFSKEELISQFDLARVQKSPAVFNPEKLEWINKEHIKKLSYEEQCRMIESFLPKSITELNEYSPTILRKITPLIIERITHFGEVSEMAEDGDIQYFFTPPQYSKEKLFWKDENDEAKLIERLMAIKERFLALPEANFAPETAKNALWDYAEKEGRGQVLWPTRYALSGKEKSPDPFLLASILGKEETLSRLECAIAMLMKK
jgi:glutamyl-tRNA synthetase